jgi:hypothetical protein
MTSRLPDPVGDSEDLESEMIEDADFEGKEECSGGRGEEGTCQGQ